jgi:hypothetical protein
MKLKGIFPSIEAVLTTGDGGSAAPARLLRQENGKYRLIDIKAHEIEAAVDAPCFGGPLVWTGSGLVSLDRNGIATAFEVSHHERDSPVRFRVAGAFYSRLLVGASDFFAVDRLQTIYVRRQHDGWFRITRNREWLPVRGLPNELVLTEFDPGSGNVLARATAFTPSALTERLANSSETGRVRRRSEHSQAPARL